MVSIENFLHRKVTWHCIVLTEQIWLDYQILEEETSTDANIKKYSAADLKTSELLNIFIRCLLELISRPVDMVLKWEVALNYSCRQAMLL